jgi:hypothetical protein
MSVFQFYQLLSETVLIVWRIQARYCYKCENIWCEVIIDPVKFELNFHFREISEEISNFIKIRRVGAELFVRTDEQADGHDEANSRFS